MVGQGRLEEADRWLGQAEQRLLTGVEPLASASLHLFRGILALAQGQDAEALRLFETSERLAGRQVGPEHGLVTVVRSYIAQTLVRKGETEHARLLLGEMDKHADQNALISAAVAVPQAKLALAESDPEAATRVLDRVLGDSGASPIPTDWLIQASLLKAIARDRCDDRLAAELSLESALDLAEPDGAILAFLLHPAPELVERHSRHRTTHASLITQIRSTQDGSRASLRTVDGEGLSDPLSESELRVLRYLPTNLSRPEVARELDLSVHTVKTHIQHLYAKLGAHSRADAVERARALGLLAPSSRRR